MNDLKVDQKLNRIHCYDEGDGPGDAEPYLWTVFWKVDGDTVMVNTDGPAPPFVQGFPTVVGTPGNHGNLGTSDVDEGDDVSIPAIIGEYHTTMKPIPLTTPFGSVTDVGGMLGCVVVLMRRTSRAMTLYSGGTRRSTAVCGTGSPRSSDRSASPSLSPPTKTSLRCPIRSARR